MTNEILTHPAILFIIIFSIAAIVYLIRVRIKSHNNFIMRRRAYRKLSEAGFPPNDKELPFPEWYDSLSKDERITASISSLVSDQKEIIDELSSLSPEHADSILQKLSERIREKAL
jgi:hypothetical protein